MATGLRIPPDARAAACRGPAELTGPTISGPAVLDSRSPGPLTLPTVAMSKKSENAAQSAPEVTGATPKRRATAESMASRQREISVSEFFTKNRHLLGFDNPAKALLTTVKEAVDNSLDACEEAGILPDIVVEIIEVSPPSGKQANAPMPSPTA